MNSLQLVDQREHMLHYLTNKVMNEGGDDNHAALMEEVSLRTFYDGLFKEVYQSLKLDETETDLTDYDCYRFLINSFEDSCGKFNDYGFKYARYLRHSCIVGTTEHIQETAKKIDNVCKGIM